MRLFKKTTIITRKIFTFAVYWSVFGGIPGVVFLTGWPAPVELYSQEAADAAEKIPGTTGATNRQKDENKNEENKFIPLADWRFWSLEFTRNDINILPNGNHNFSPLEYWFPGAILSNPDNGGFAALEPVTLAIHGESVKWLRFRLNGLDITNPEDPGRPLVYLPVDLWSSYRVLSPLYSYNKDFGLNWATRQEKSGLMVFGGIAGFLGGVPLVPPKFMDREPAQDWGANEKRRSMAMSPEGGISASFAGLNQLPATVFFEGISQRRTFTTLDGYETGNRYTVYLGQDVDEKYAASVFYQHLDRNHFGIETGNSDDKSLHGGTDSLLLTLAAINPDAKFSYGVNAGYGHKKYEQNNPHPTVLDLEDEIVYGKIPEPSESHSWFVTNNLDFNKIHQLWIFDVDVFSRVRLEGLHRQNLYPENRIAHSFNKVASDIIVYDSNPMYSQYLARVNPGAKLTAHWQTLNLEISAGALLESGFSARRYLLTRIDPVAGIKLFSNPGNPWEIYTGYQHDAIPVSNDELTFLNPDSASGARYSWTDTNSNGIPEAFETGTMYNRTGGKYHTLAKNMKFPTRDELYLGVIRNFSPKWRAMFSVQGKLYGNLYDVVFDPSVNSGYSAISRPDMAGGVLYNRDISAMGNELYQLTNRADNGYFAGVEIQVLKKNDKDDPWFVQLGLGAYYSEAHTIAGNSPDYNDMGQFAESGADPNKRLNTLAVTDSNRGYLVNLLLGFHSGPFSLANSLRYRDGQPLGHMVVAQGLTQGPTIVQNQNRADPPNGTPRYTFAMTWDIRLTLQVPAQKFNTSFSLDVYNVLDSRTELYEYTLPNERYRDPVETVTGRSYRLLVHMRW